MANPLVLSARYTINARAAFPATFGCVLLLDRCSHTLQKPRGHRRPTHFTLTDQHRLVPTTIDIDEPDSPIRQPMQAGIHVFCLNKDADGRDKPGHDVSQRSTSAAGGITRCAEYRAGILPATAAMWLAMIL